MSGVVRAAVALLMLLVVAQIPTRVSAQGGFVLAVMHGGAVEGTVGHAPVGRRGQGREQADEAAAAAVPPAEVVTADYAPPTDVATLVSRPADLYGQRLLLFGRVVAVQVAPAGLAFTVGETEPRRFSVFVQMGVLAPDGTEEIVAVGYNGDPAGIAEGTYVLVYGEPVDVFRGISVRGDEIVQPLVAAALIETR